MYLVHERKNKPGTWEVAWTWLPQFLGADPKLVKEVDLQMTALLQETKDMEPATRMGKLHSDLITLITRRYPIRGLAHYLSASFAVQPEEHGDDRLQC